MIQAQQAVETFRLNGLAFEYERAKPHNCERAVEAPLGRWFLAQFGNSVIEVGAVMPYYQERTEHRVWDLYDPWPGCFRWDATKQTYLDSDVLSISTIEHVGRNVADYRREGVPAQPADEAAAERLLARIALQARAYLVTWPIGFHKRLDAWARASGLPHLILKRLDEENRWALHDDPDDFAWEYNRPFGAANGLCVCSNLADLAWRA